MKVQYCRCDTYNKIIPSYYFLTAEAVQQGLIWAGVSVYKVEILLKCSPSQSEHSLRLTNQSEDSI